MTREEIEKELGDPDNFVLSRNNIALLRKWAIACGHPPVDVNSWNGVELTNRYHAGAKKSTPDIHRITSEILVSLLEALNVPGFNVDLMKEIASKQFDRQFDDWSDTITREIQKRIDALPPKKLEIVIDAYRNVIDGPMHYITEKVLRVVALAHPVMLVGPAGCGKTTIAEHVARALSLPFYITNAINETHELTGFIDGYGNYHPTAFRNAFEFGGVWVADEIDAWDASALLAANSALANGYVNFPDRQQPVLRNANFRMVATANTFGTGADRVYIGRNELDAASLDRFAMIEVDYDLSLERIFANGNQKWLDRVWKVRKIVNEKKIRHVVSSRPIIMGSAGLAAGLEWQDVENFYLFKGMSESDRKKIQ